MNKIIATNGYIGITNVIHDFDDFVELENGQQCIVNYEEEIPYFELNGEKYYLNEFIRTNI